MPSIRPLRLLRVHTRAPPRTRGWLFTRVWRTGRRDPSGAQLEIRGPLFVVLVFRISPSGTEDAVSGDRIYGLAASTWKEYQEILVTGLEISLLIVPSRTASAALAVYHRCSLNF